MRATNGTLVALFALALSGCGTATTPRHEPTTPSQPNSESADIGPFPTLVVKLSFPNEHPVYSAALYLFQGQFEATSPGQLEDKVKGADPLDEKLVLDHRESASVEFTNVRPGEYTVCATGIIGAMSDPATQQRIDAMGDSDGTEPMTCQSVKIVEQPDRQDLSLAVTPI